MSMEQSLWKLIDQACLLMQLVVLDKNVLLTGALHATFCHEFLNDIGQEVLELAPYRGSLSLSNIRSP